VATPPNPDPIAHVLNWRGTAPDYVNGPTGYQAIP
jgi:hypothetical protein